VPNFLPHPAQNRLLKAPRLRSTSLPFGYVNTVTGQRHDRRIGGLRFCHAHATGILKCQQWPSPPQDDAPHPPKPSAVCARLLSRSPSSSCRLLMHTHGEKPFCVGLSRLVLAITNSRCALCREPSGARCPQTCDCGQGRYNVVSRPSPDC
jgi:hypothetical protein